MCDHHDTSHFTRPTRPMSRRTFAQAGSGLLIAGAGLASSTGTAVAAGVPAVGRGASRRSRISGPGTRLVHADLHNHTLFSDGDGDPANAFDSMRNAGLDVAALTDHATFSDNVLGEILAGLLPQEYKQVAGITQANWDETAAYANSANTNGAFTAIRGFEWSEPLIGHVNVWFTEHYVDVLQAGVMQPLLDWLAREPGLVLDGGADGLAGFNHPGRERFRFQEFYYDERLRDRIVSLEMFNRQDDYLFEGYADGMSSPLCACLNAGWRTGLAGVTDEHGTDWGFPEGKGRTGMWVRKHTRAGVKAAMKQRRFFATRTSGLRVDAKVDIKNGRKGRMGSTIPVTRDKNVMRVRLDLARDREWRGRTLHAQVLRPGPEVPEVVKVVPFEVGPVLDFCVKLDVNDGDWMVVRISDPDQPNASPGPDGHPCNDLGVAYTSPWWFERG